jgi:hypothetical protein
MGRMGGDAPRQTSSSRPPQARGARRFRPKWAHRLTAPLRALPNLLVIGAQKAGTTSLHDFLGQQPEIRMSRIKECNVLWTPGWSLLGYRSYFPRRSTCAREGVRRIGESSPFYLFHPAAIEGARRLDAATTDLRAIAILRDPVERAWSHYRHAQRWHHEGLSFEEALDREEERIAQGGEAFRHYSYQARGHYAGQLARWFDLLGRDRVLVLDFEDALSMEPATRLEIARFLGLSRPLVGDLGRLNPGGGERMPDAVRERLHATFRRSNEELATLLGRRFPWMRA